MNGFLCMSVDTQRPLPLWDTTRACMLSFVGLVLLLLCRTSTVQLLKSISSNYRKLLRL